MAFLWSTNGSGTSLRQLERVCASIWAASVREKKSVSSELCHFAGWQKQLGLFIQRCSWGDQWCSQDTKWVAGRGKQIETDDKKSRGATKSEKLEYYVKRGESRELTGHLGLAQNLFTLQMADQREPHIWNTTRTGCDWLSEFEVRGGRTGLTWGSGLLIEWWKTDRVWEGTAGGDGWMDRQKLQEEFEPKHWTVGF